jgi:predicted nucleic acid-binding protein
MEITFKELVLMRYCGEFLQADEANATIRKTSEEIMVELRPTAEISINEISQFLVNMDYELGFDDATPVWLMRENPSRKLINQ